MLADKLERLIVKYHNAEISGQLENASEETMRVWINELLSIFGWDVMNTNQILQEKTLGIEERSKLQNIGSRNIRPDYTFVNGKVKIAFLDAKDIDINIEQDKSAAFQIRSYGWSIGAKFSILTNFKELAIYECCSKPYVDDPATFSRIHFFKYSEYISNLDTLRVYLERSKVLVGRFPSQPKGQSLSLDQDFAQMLCGIRIKLATAIMKASYDGIDLDTLSILSQIIINRILFIRVCEARGIEEEGLLLQYLNGGFWNNFRRSSYFDFHEHYDGPLFQRITYLNDLDLTDDVFIELLSYLYNPSPYRFDVIPIKTLSDIYDLFLSYELKNDNGHLINVLRSEFKKSNGAITTPEFIVQNVINMSLGGRLDSLSNKDILNLKFVDPACGSGVFLIGIYETLLKTILGNIEHGDNSFDQFIIENSHPILTIKGKKQIITQCIYGVDINAEAVEVTKMSLSLKMIDDFDPLLYEKVGISGKYILKEVGNNIKCGNSLVSSNALEMYPQLNTDLEQLNDIRVFDWNKSFPMIFKHGGFDYVIGNPPYVEVKNYNQDIPYMAIYIKDTYPASKNGKVDLAIPFIEKGINLLNNSGRLGYIVQKRFFKTDYGKGIRKLLTQNRLVNTIYDYQETDLFVGRITYVAIMVCDKDIKNNEVIKYRSSIGTKEELISSESIGTTPWSFDNIALNNVRIHTAQRHQCLKDACKVKVGIQVLWDKAYHINVKQIKQGYIYGSSAIDDNIKIEVDACRPLVCNEKFKSLSKVSYNTYAIFPYFVNKGTITPILYSEYVQKYPLAGKYLAKHKNEILENVEILPHRDSSYSVDDGWHLYTRANNHGAINKKICIPMTALMPQACVIRDMNVYCDNANMSFIQVEDDNEDRLYALSAIICSDVFNLFARSIANPQAGGYMKFNKQFLDPVPIPNFDLAIPELSKLAREIENINIKIEEKKGINTDSLQISLHQHYVELNRKVYSLYTFPNEEANVINQILFDKI